jgi:hypothetical protein
MKKKREEEKSFPKDRTKGMNIKTPSGIWSVVMDYTENMLIVVPDVILKPFREEIAWDFWFVHHLDLKEDYPKADQMLRDLVYKLKYGHEMEVPEELLDKFIDYENKFWKERQISYKKSNIRYCNPFKEEIVKSILKDLERHKVVIPAFNDSPFVTVKLKSWQRLEVSFE